jgi:hypothetical protein
MALVVCLIIQRSVLSHMCDSTSLCDTPTSFWAQVTVVTELCLDVCPLCTPGGPCILSPWQPCPSKGV